MGEARSIAVVVCFSPTTEALDEEKTAFYEVLDAFLGKKKMKDALSNVLTNV